MQAMMPNHPLCVDCDGTLIATDLLHEAVFLLAKQNPTKLFLLPFWLLKGKAYLKLKLSEYVTFNWSSLPYRQEVITLIQEAKKQGRKIVLATASPKVWAEGVAHYLNIFDEVLATNNQINLAARNKANKLIETYGQYQFDYIGDSQADLPVWTNAHQAIVINKGGSFTKKVKAQHGVTLIRTQGSSLSSYLKALRIHQWLKNLLIFLPLLAAHQLGNSPLLMNTVYAFIAFSACASSVYILNDLLDLESDRLHIRKSKRPFAAGRIPILQGAFGVPILLAIAFLISLNYLPIAFTLVLLLYYVMTFAYSVRLKQQVIVDILMLAALYTSRIIAGSAATNIIPSFWLLEFSMFIFLSLALVKRYSELSINIQQNKNEISGRGYRREDLTVVMALGASSAMCSVMVFSLYINSQDTNLLYPSKYWLWGVIPLILYWNSRIWMKTNRGEVEDDPVLFAVKDWQTLVIATAGLYFFMLASH